jgi:hypothetical protein
MSDLRNEIPQRAFINAQILQQAALTPDFQAAVQQVAKVYGLIQYEFMNPAYVASLLYCLLVLPREVFASDDQNALLLDRALPAALVASFFDVDTISEDAQNRSSQFIRRLRNSVAHARFTVDNDMNFRFTDRSPRDQADTFIVRASAAMIINFLSHVGSFLANLRSNPLTAADTKP